MTLLYPIPTIIDLILSPKKPIQAQEERNEKVG